MGEGVDEVGLAHLAGALDEQGLVLRRAVPILEPGERLALEHVGLPCENHLCPRDFTLFRIS